MAIVWIVTATFSLPVWAQSTPPAAEILPSLPFAPGEDLNFAVKYGVVRAGDARLAVEAGKTPDLYRFLSTAKSSRFFDTFFPVDDRVVSDWSSSLRVPMHFEKRSREGKYKKDVSYRFDHDLGVALYSNGRREKILAGTQDVLSAFYIMRTHKLVPGTTFEIPNHADGKNYELVVKVHERETVDVPAGRFSCVVVEPLLRTSGLFKQEGRLLIWVTDDSRHMPVLMKSKIAVGSIVAELESFRLGRPVEPAQGTGAPAQGNAGGR
ncbi:MAG TPA: DUF3108 domain-containing protein [Candidatus Eisenbacteria bacterium]|nr:DUF3108 domain-containing protein [Candidatus Eisenbacteria bacterium]